jgi:hypothetical protein
MDEGSTHLCVQSALLSWQSFVPTNFELVVSSNLHLHLLYNNKKQSLHVST